MIAIGQEYSFLWSHNNETASDWTIFLTVAFILLVDCSHVTIERCL